MSGRASRGSEPTSRLVGMRMHRMHASCNACGITTAKQLEYSPRRRGRAHSTLPPLGSAFAFLPSAGAAPLVELSPSEVIARASPGRRTHTFGEINKTFLGGGPRDQPRITSVFSKAPAPWNFDHRAFGDERRDAFATSSHPSTSMDDFDDAAVARACALEDADHEGSRALAQKECVQCPSFKGLPPASSNNNKKLTEKNMANNTKYNLTSRLKIVSKMATIIGPILGKSINS